MITHIPFSVEKWGSFANYFVEAIPRDLDQVLFSYLSLPATQSLKRTCKLIGQIIQDDPKIWHRFLCTFYPRQYAQLHPPPEQNYACLQTIFSKMTRFSHYFANAQQLIPQTLDYLGSCTIGFHLRETIFLRLQEGVSKIDIWDLATQRQIGHMPLPDHVLSNEVLRLSLHGNFACYYAHCLKDDTTSLSLCISDLKDIPRVIQKLEFGKAGAQNLSQAIADAEAAPVQAQGRCRQAQSLGYRHSQNQLSNHEGYTSKEPLIIYNVQSPYAIVDTTLYCCHDTSEVHEIEIWDLKKEMLSNRLELTHTLDDPHFVVDPEQKWLHCVARNRNEKPDDIHILSVNLCDHTQVLRECVATIHGPLQKALLKGSLIYMHISTSPGYVLIFDLISEKLIDAPTEKKHPRLFYFLKEKGEVKTSTFHILDLQSPQTHKQQIEIRDHNTCWKIDGYDLFFLQDKKVHIVDLTGSSLTNGLP